MYKIYESIQQQYHINSKSLKKITQMQRNQNTDISYSSDEQSSIVRQPNTYFRDDDMQVQNNQTAASFQQNINDDDDSSYHQVSQLFQRFYYKQLIKKKSRHQRLQDSKIFTKFKNIIRAYPPKPKLYFLPTTILFPSKIQKIIQLRDSIVKYYGNIANVKMPKQKNVSQIQVIIHDEQQLSSYLIKSINLSKYYQHKFPQLLDQDLSLNRLFEFYQENYSEVYKFSQTCGILLYWAYQKRLLSNDFLSESALKLIVIFFYFSLGKGIPNIIFTFYQKQKKWLESLKKRYNVNKKYQCIIQPQLFQQYNFSLRQQRSFYHQSQKKYLTTLQILPVPFPISKQDFLKYSENQKKKDAQQQRPHKYYAMTNFFELMLYLDNSIKRTQRVIFNFVKSRKGVTTCSQTNFNIQIKHPIFGNNICQKLTNDPSKLGILKREIGNVVNIYKNSSNTPIQALSRIFEKQ